MFRSILALFLILAGIPLIAAACHGDSTVLQTEAARLQGLYAGIALVIAGFILGKFWSLKWKQKRSFQSAQTAPHRSEPIEEQIDLFEPRNNA